MDDEATRLFVYGSLKRGFRHHDQMRGARFLGCARTAPGYRLVTYQEGYPALTRSEAEPPSGNVSGELFLVAASHLARLDEFEEAPTLYQRGPVALDTGMVVQSYLIEEGEASRWPAVARESWRESPFDRT